MPRTSKPAYQKITPPVLIDPRWLLKALLLTLAVAGVLAYLSVCLLVYLGGWQLMLSPSASVTATPQAPFQSIRFDAAATGAPRLTAWWIPAASPTPLTPTLLFLHDGAGSLSTSVRKLDLLHQANVNLFAIDYRGFGQSSPPHPTEARMAEDASAALDYLVDTRHLAAATIIPYGEGLGAVLAAKLSAGHPQLPALIVDNPDPDAFTRATTAGKSRLLPMRLLVRDRFDLRAAVDASHAPRLLLAGGPLTDPAAPPSSTTLYFRSVPDPKMTVIFAQPGSNDLFLASLRRFLDEYLPR